MSSPADVFAPPGVTWTPVSPRYGALRRLSTAAGWIVVVAVAVVPTALAAPGWIAWVLGAVGLAVIVWRVARQGAIARSWGFAERDTDLYIRHGIWIRRLTVVPYGRMQAVEVSSGPLDRAFGLSDVKLVTASAQSDAHIPGLEPDDAAALRDRLTLRGETQAAGL
ncbi:PH domain-containing protein [Brooklawnia cerclae]|uniref:YdbS-like PH domain-containing protein n=1 Tax=Brooklawnia cerclae TaxID=349934 RepID=A0ABX0SJY5_9ACTN|nr:PH domain-containing protein [Brooklawnia cerclae]NIH58291.1 hypothetical protein [Brooklawnia cerclae]